MAHLLDLDLAGIFFGLPVNYLAALFTLVLCVFSALYFSNIFKDKTELEDEGLGPDELPDELTNSHRHTQINDDEDDDDDDDDDDYEDDEAYEEQFSDSEVAEDEDDEEEAELSHSGQDYNHLMGKIKAKRLQHKLEKNLTPSQIEEERRIEREQLAAIFELLRKQEQELNLKDRISDHDLKEQVRLYR
ncbi:nonsense-mediated mRNA decay protein 2 [Drosophila willistoni]|uniref:nonsense-mediated mRNA decay protein 2 n=1 Tax=Drosophila willistoni TaxID=7260 RepID=UPI00017D697F|nr:nonsense-mediated mRNA decay protein 2 [Drosophila willistoni]